MIISTLGWIAVGAIGWLAVATVVGVVLGRIIRRRDEQVPGQSPPTTGPASTTPEPEQPRASRAAGGRGLRRR